MTDHSLGIGTCTHSMTIPSYLHSEMYLQKNPWPNGISKLDRALPSWSLRKSEESRARITVAQEIEGTSSLKDLVDPKSITRKDFSHYEELNLMMAAELKWCWSTKLPSVEPWQYKRAKKSYTAEKILQRETSGSCSRRDACSFLHRHAAGDREDNVEWSGDRREILTWSKHTLQYRKWRNRLTGKAWTV